MLQLKLPQHRDSYRDIVLANSYIRLTVESRFQKAAAFRGWLIINSFQAYCQALPELSSFSRHLPLFVLFYELPCNTKVVAI